MLKFFRQYNKYILVVGGSLLMVAFLIQPAMSIFVPQAGDQEIGQINGEPVTLEQRATASAELEVLSQLPPLTNPMFLPLDQGDASVQWLLMLHDARNMGLSASDAEVQGVLDAIGADPAYLARLQQAMRTTDAFIRQAVRHWIMAQNYQTLVFGEAYIPLTTRIAAVGAAMQFAQQGNPFWQMMLASASGSPRLSEPLLAHFVANQSATVAGETVLVSHERFLDQVTQPSEEQVQTLFEENRDNLPGQGEPYGFGYRQPARVQIEWLTIPAEAVKAQVRIDEAEALEYYEENKEAFRVTGEDGQAVEQSYVEARPAVLEALRRRKTAELATEAAMLARNVLLADEPTRRLSRAGGYFDIPADFQPMDLDAAADQVAQRLGVRPTVERRTQAWVPVDEAASLPGLGRAMLVGRDGIDFASYLRSARELEPDASNPLVPLRLQASLPSEPLRDFQGNYYVFRLVDAAPARSPQSLDEVREQVVQDARKAAAYELLLENREQFETTAREQGLQALADQLQTSLLRVPPTPQMEFSGTGAAPQIPGVGPSEALLEAMFDTAQKVTGGEASAPVSDAPEAERIGSAGVDPRLSLAVFRVDAFNPITRSAFEQQAAAPWIGPSMKQTLLADRVTENPLSLESLAARVGYTGEGLE